MPDNIKKIFAGGFNLAQWGLPGEDGIVRGIVGQALAQNAVSGLGQIPGVKTANVQIPAGEVLVGTGNDGFIGALHFYAAAPIEFDLEVGQFNIDFTEAMGPANSYDEGAWTLMPMHTDATDFNQIMLLLTARALSRASGSDGVKGFWHVVLPLCEAQHLGPGGLSERGELLERFHVVSTLTDRYPWGKLVTLADEGVTRVSAFYWYSTKRFTIDTWRADGLANTFIVAQTPVAGWTGGTGESNRVRMFVEDAGTGVVTQTDPWAVTTATRTVQVAQTTPPTEDDLHVVAYEYV